MDEPRDVKVARVLGWTDFKQISGTLGYSSATSWWVGLPPWTQDKSSTPLYPHEVPNFANLAAWVIRMIEANRPSIEDDDGTWFVCSWQRCCGGGCDSDGDNLVQGTGKTLGDAVCAWVIAAAEAGVEVRQ